MNLRYDIALLYLQQSDYDLGLAVEAYLADEVRTFLRRICRFDTEVESQDMSREQTDLIYSRDLSCDSTISLREVMLT